MSYKVPPSLMPTCLSISSSAHDLILTFSHVQVHWSSIVLLDSLSPQAPVLTVDATAS